MKNIGVVSISFALGYASALHFPAAAAATTKETVLHSFSGGTDGANPSAGVLYLGGMLYGVTYQGGAYNFGTAFSVDAKTGAETVLHSFGSGADGVNPNASLINAKGTLYGTTLWGGSNNGCGSPPGCGTVFSLAPSTGTESVLYSFCSQQNCTDGENPYASLLAVNGKLYGTTVYGGIIDDSSGTVFALDRKTGAEAVIYSFCNQNNCEDGAWPTDNLIDVKGTLYGTTFGAGRGENGTVFALDSNSGVETVLYNFGSQENAIDGSSPYAGLIDVDGMLYGTTSQGGSNSCNGYGCGTVFSVNPTTGEEKVLYSFCSRQNCTDGAYPEGNLIDVNGMLYGTTQAGGGESCQNSGCGIVFSVDPATGVENVLYSFCSQHNCTDGEYPTASLIYVKGRLYGTTGDGGAHGYGTVFALKTP